MDKLEPHIAGGIKNGASSLGDSLVASQKVKHEIIIWFSSFLPKYVAKKIESTHPHKNLYMSVRSGIMHTSHKVEETQMSVNRWMDK